MSVAEVQASPSTRSKQRGETAVAIRNLSKRYGATEAVRSVNLDVRAGEIFGVIGPDGAGKTSTFQILAGIMEATSGEAIIFGRPAREARLQTGYLTQTFSLYTDLSVAENIRYIGDLRRVPPSDIRSRGDHYLEIFDMLRFRDRLAGQLSGGMKQKLALACALVAKPRILLLDEPTTGVDPVSRREFWDTLAHLSADGLTIVVATPYLDEAERCNRVALMHLGEIQEMGTPRELRENLHARRLEVRASDLGRAEDILSEKRDAREGITDVQRFGDRLDLITPDAEQGRRTVERLLSEEGIRIDDIREEEPTLENAFVTILRGLQHQEAAPPFPRKRKAREPRDKAAIKAESLSKSFGPFVAVNHVSLEIKYGEIYGLLGANGAGKTTTIKMLCGLLTPSSGTMELAGERGSLRSSAVRQRIGYMSQKFSLYDDLSIGENLDFFAGVYGVPPKDREERMRWVLAFSGLEGKQDQITGSLPGGWKQRVAFGASIMHEPGVLFLDEPTSGVDPLARRAFWRMINQLADWGTAILITTHYLEEAEQCNRLGFMVAGELVAEGTPSEVKARQGGHLIELDVDQPQRAADLLKTKEERWRVSLFGDRLHVITDEDVEQGMGSTRQKLEENGLEVRSVREGRYSLEDVFIVAVEKARKEGKVAQE